MPLRTPTDLERDQLIHLYDPVKAHEYYLRNRKLHPRKKGEQSEGFARANARRHESAKAKQKRELAARITNLEKKLRELEKLIQTKEATLRRDQASAKSTAKKERSAKEKNKPKSAADKAKAARENKKYRDKHKQEIKNKAKQASNKSGGGSHQKKASSDPSKKPISELKTLATKVRGQIAVAKQKLAAL